LEILNKHH
jgi:hypothetical protein